MQNWNYDRRIDTGFVYIPFGESLINVTSKTDHTVTYNEVVFYDGTHIVNDHGEIVDHKLINAYIAYPKPTNDYVDRLNVEHDDIHDKIYKLAAFINKGINVDELHHEQLLILNKYKDILMKRIEQAQGH